MDGLACSFPFIRRLVFPVPHRAKEHDDGFGVAQFDVRG